MSQPFGHEKLIVYQKAMHFATLRGGLLDDLTASVEEGRELLRRIAAMLTALSKAVTYD